MEKEVGLETFFTDTLGVKGRVKVYPEDFKVYERIDLPELEEGRFSIAKVSSRNWETNRLVLELAKRLDIDRNDICFAGTKDKRAITIQWMSFRADPEDLEEVEINGVTIEEIKSSHRSLHIGAHQGNDFEVIIRQMEFDKEKVMGIADETGQVIDEKGGFPNWFGVQRFGTLRPITHRVGKRILEGDIKGAVRLYLGNPMDDEAEECYNAREYLDQTWDYEEALEKYPKALKFERSMLRSLVEKEDYVRALKRLPHNLRKMFVHAYQSYLFNRILSMRLERGLPINEALAGDILLPTRKNGLPNKDTPVEITERNVEKASNMVKKGKAYVSGPLFGRNTKYSKGEQGDIERKVVEEEGVEKEDFIIPELPSLSSTGARRELLAPVKNLKWGWDSSGLKLSFGLNKGSYATTLLREFMKLPDSEVSRYS